MFTRKISNALRVFLFVLWTLPLVFLLLIAQFLIPSKKALVLKAFHGGVCKIFKIDVHANGAMSDQPKTIFVANHASYMDIPILGSVLEGQFIAKSDVAKWPIMGHLARLQNTIYIERRRLQAKKQVTQLGNALAMGGNLIIFPEGTNTLGDQVKPFKASLFGDDVMEQKPIIQPVSIIYSMPDGTPLPQNLRPVFGWPLEAGFAEHCWQMLQYDGMRADIIFHQSIDCTNDTDRKHALFQAHHVVEKSVLNAT